jgi:hypothetical protein
MNLFLKVLGVITVNVLTYAGIALVLYLLAVGLSTMIVSF